MKCACTRRFRPRPVRRFNHLQVWALYAIHRLVVWEVPLMPARVVWLRAAVSLPLPFIAAAMAMLLAQP